MVSGNDDLGTYIGMFTYFCSPHSERSHSENRSIKTSFWNSYLHSVSASNAHRLPPAANGILLPGMSVPALGVTVTTEALPWRWLTQPPSVWYDPYFQDSRFHTSYYNYAVLSNYFTFPAWGSLFLTKVNCNYRTRRYEDWSSHAGLGIVLSDAFRWLRTHNATGVDASGTLWSGGLRGTGELA